MHRVSCPIEQLRVIAAIAAGLVAISTAKAASSDRPNLVVILCDDLGYGDLQCYGHPHIQTPRLNELAAGGIRFTDCYSAAPVCSPSRVGLLTGRSPNRAGVFDWIPPAGDQSRSDARDQVHLRRTEITIAKLLHDAEYATCMAGKWHCNSRFNQPSQPQPNDFGFEHWLGTQNNAQPSHENPLNFVRNGEPTGPMTGYSCQLVVDEAIQWLDSPSRNTEKPFFLYLAFHEPHEPVASPPNLVAHYREQASSDEEASYFANVANVDRAVGRIMDGLQDRKLREQTLIVFTSDNGPETLRRYRGAERSYGTPGPLRGMKLHTHDAGFRVAGIANWPAQVAPGQIVATPVSSLDLLPTFCELAHVQPPSNLSLDGTSLVPLLQDQPLVRTKPLVWCYYNAINDARVAMREGKWKVLARLDGGKLPRMENLTTDQADTIRNVPLTDWEIYDMSRDVAESTNLADDPTVPAQELCQRLTDHFRELNANSHLWSKSE